MEDKAFWRSKTFWGLVEVLAAYLLPKLGLPIAPEVQDAVINVLLGKGVTMAWWGRAVADTKLTTKRKRKGKVESQPSADLEALLPLIQQALGASKKGGK